MIDNLEKPASFEFNKTDVITSVAVEKNTNKGSVHFNFIDTIRFLAMMGIVWEHCMIVQQKYSSVISTIIAICSFQIFKFVTIAFFIIGGFLINHKFQENTPIQYLKNRFAGTILPWSFWVTILIIINISTIIFLSYNGQNPFPELSPIQTLIKIILRSVFATSYWFIPNFLLSITVLLLFKKYLYNFWLGIILAALSLTYSVNIYYNWFISAHTTALFGFIFYLWLGVTMNRNYKKISDIITNVSWWVLIVVATTLYILAVSESFLLLRIGNENPLNTLRITNILYSLAMFIILLKVGKIDFITKICEPRKTTFGIYLIHWIIVTFLVDLILSPLHITINNLSLFLAIVISLVRFVIVYVSSFYIIKLMIKTKFAFLVGVKSK